MEIKLYTKKIIRIILIIILFMSVFYFGIYQFRIGYMKRILTGNQWYISNVVKVDGSALERDNSLSSKVYKFNKNNTYTIYSFVFPELRFVSYVYYGNETFKLKSDSLILDDNLRAKINIITKDSIVITHLQNYTYYDPIAHGETLPLRFTLKPIYIKPEPDTFVIRKDRSLSKPIIID